MVTGREEDRRERRSSNHIVEEHERGNMNNISARRMAESDRRVRYDTVVGEKERREPEERAKTLRW